jgi:hypothetical protein
VTARGPRRAARTWRRTRPFWGGLLLLLGGLEMLLIPLTGVLARGQIKLVIYVGIGGVFGILIGALLIACGLALWFSPVHKTFYAIAGLLLSLLSFIGTNLGGFFLGMLLGIVGGSLAFAWTPGPAGDPRSGDGTGPGPGEPLRADWGLSEPRRRRPGWPGSASRSLAVAALLAVAGATLAGGGGRASGAEVHPAQGQPGQGCILFVICSPSPSATAAPASTPGGGRGNGPLPIPTVLPASGNGLPTAVAGLGGTGPGAGPLAPPGPGATSRAQGPDNKRAPGTQGLVVAREPSVITARSATLDGLAYQGRVNLPVSGGGTVTMMKFTMTSQQLSGLDLTVAGAGAGAGGSLATAASSASFSGAVVLYATRLTGRLAGVPLTLTPGNAESTLLQVLKSLTPLVPVTLTDVTADQPVVLGGSAAITALSVRAS